jgi:hypothetical protein
MQLRPMVVAVIDIVFVPGVVDSSPVLGSRGPTPLSDDSSRPGVHGRGDLALRTVPNVIILLSVLCWVAPLMMTW